MGWRYLACLGQQIEQQIVGSVLEVLWYRILLCCLIGIRETTVSCLEISSARQAATTLLPHWSQVPPPLLQDCVYRKCPTTRPVWVFSPSHLFQWAFSPAWKCCAKLQSHAFGLPALTRYRPSVNVRNWAHLLYPVTEEFHWLSFICSKYSLYKI